MHAVIYIIVPKLFYVYVLSNFVCLFTSLFNSSSFEHNKNYFFTVMSEQIQHLFPHTACMKDFFNVQAKPKKICKKKITESTGLIILDYMLM